MATTLDETEILARVIALACNGREVNVVLTALLSIMADIIAANSCCAECRDRAVGDVRDALTSATDAIFENPAPKLN